ncbi:Imm50 family immunity protein [Streptomyces sp. NPDC004111]|uniref:Imm50 family immunity protein n=1 Tax=Streptomyces sp. NPDC004111 TaxID=3364690 RepID=UPI0036A072FF
MTPSRVRVANWHYLASLYGEELPPLDRVRLRSLHLNWRGPALTLRIDLPSPPLALPEEGADPAVDTFQCHLQFMNVQDLSVTNWKPPITARLSTSPRSAENRIEVTVDQNEIIFLQFTSLTDIIARHLSTFQLSPGGTDQGPHLFKDKLDKLINNSSIPEPHKANFHGR